MNNNEKRRGDNMGDRLSGINRRQFTYPVKLPKKGTPVPLLTLLLHTEMEIRHSDNGGRRSGMDRRQFSYYSIYVPERRSEKDRRSRKDRRKQWLRPQQGVAQRLPYQHNLPNIP